MNKRDLLYLSLQDLCNSIGRIDVVCLTETFLKQGSESNLKLDSYRLVSYFSRENQRRGGSCILVKSDIESQPINNLIDSIPRHFEMCAAKIMHGNIIVVCIYRTPDSDVQIFFEALNRLLQKIKINNKKTVILCGDWNIDILKANKISQRLKSILSNYNLKNHVLKPTRKSSCIDLFASNLSATQCNTHFLALSDHETAQTLSFETKVKLSDLKPQTWFEERRDFNDDNVIKFQECMSSLFFTDILLETDVNKAFNEFHDILLLFFNLCFPKIKVKITKKHSRTHWITKGLKKCCIRKRQYYLKYNLSKANKKNNHKKYHNYSKILKKCILRAQKINNANFIKQSTNRCKAAWKLINDNFNKKNCKSDIQEIHVDHNGKFTDPQKIATLFNDYYINLSNKVITDSNNKISTLTTNINNTIYLTPTDPIFVLKTIKALKNSNSTGYDEINTNILKVCAMPLCIPLCHLINLSFTEGIFPERLKYSIVKPIYKKGNECEMNNYRPITLIPIISKIFEKIMCSKLTNFIEKNNILKPEQFGFRKNSSTTDACFKLIKLIMESLDKKTPIIALFLDMTKAFDFVNHSTLLQKLNYYGIRGKAHEWLKSYLSDRYQSVEINKIVKSDKKSFRSQYRLNQFGVPQGSVLGPLLFLLYINDLPNATKHQCVLFADDTTILIRREDKAGFAKDVNEALSNVMAWLHTNNLSVNISKTKVIEFQTFNGNPTNVSISHGHNVIDKVNETKFLGITIDKFCNWKAHVNSLCSKLDRFVYVLYRLRQIATKEAALSAYHGYVSSCLRYGIILWGFSVDAERAFLVQKKCIRSLTGADFLDSCKPLFKKLKILPFPSLYIYEICLFVKKHPNLFIKQTDIVKRSRQTHKLYVPIQRLQLTSKNVNCMAIRVFNKLPDMFKEYDINKFKKSVFDFLLDKCYYCVKDYLNDSSISTYRYRPA